MDKNQNNQYAIDERRRKVASLLAQSKTETEIAEELGILQALYVMYVISYQKKGINISRKRIISMIWVTYIK